MSKTKNLKGDVAPLTSIDLLYAPFNTEQVEKLNKFQKNEFVHPYTCGGNRADEKHLDGEGVLVATKNGWICPFCDYTQETAARMLLDLADHNPFHTQPSDLPESI